MSGILSLTLLGLCLGLLLGYAARVFAVETDDAVADIVQMMPGTNCGQCGLAGCQAAAEAMARGEVAPTVCPGGGVALAQAIAARLGVTLQLDGFVERGPQLATISEDLCIGCSKCLRHCATDAILGAAKQIHGVLDEACTGCGACAEHCPTGAIALHAVPPSLQDWNWARPAFA